MLWLVRKALGLLGRGVGQAPPGHRLLGRGRFRNSPEEATLVGTGHQRHGRGHGRSGAIMNGAPRAVDARQLDGGGRQQPRQILQALVNPLSNVGHSQRQEVAVSSSG